jgi:hypothetical protein
MDAEVLCVTVSVTCRYLPHPQVSTQEEAEEAEKTEEEEEEEEQQQS